MWKTWVKQFVSAFLHYVLRDRDPEFLGCFPYCKENICDFSFFAILCLPQLNYSFTFLQTSACTIPIYTVLDFSSFLCLPRLNTSLIQSLWDAYLNSLFLSANFHFLLIPPPSSSLLKKSVTSVVVFLLLNFLHVAVPAYFYLLA